MGQIRMKREHMDHLPERILEPGYVLRAAVPKDRKALAHLLEHAYGEGFMDSRWVDQELLGNALCPVTYVIEKGRELVATATAKLMPDKPDTGWLHFVASDSAHKGKGLGEVASIAVLKEFRRLGMKRTELSTDDHRLAAISIYLKLGYEPDFHAPDHPERWDRILATLRASRSS